MKPALIRGAQPVAAAYEEVIARFVQWAESDDNIRAAFIIGSRTRTDHPADEWADLDIAIIARDANRYWLSPAWVSNIGNCWLSFIEDAAGGGRELRVMFEGGLDVDFAPVSFDLLRTMLERDEIQALQLAVGRGMRILLDRDGITRRIEPLVGTVPAYQPPTEAVYINTVSDFWYYAVWTAKHLRRGELWWAKSGCDSHQKSLLSSMLEWHARATAGSAHDTWFRGRFLEEWIDPRARAVLSGIYARYDEPDVWRALGETMALFRWVAVETARRLGYRYPSDADRHAAEIVELLGAVGTSCAMRACSNEQPE